ncbi:transposase (plasmid) [Natrarchaeobaculum sulfurireducens]|uniref:Transposase n=1 Tax=Natrarchaeobaculum sulfurireducens TaxID=2044521 RepID=A0A346P9Q7_9EURY|nr:transposase [Natrarchaeobaculum sulfurireducens]
MLGSRFRILFESSRLSLLNRLDRPFTTGFTRPISSRNPDHVAVDETVIRLNDEQYWLYTVADLDSNELLHTKLELTRNKVIASNFVRELREKHDVNDAVFLISGDRLLQYGCEHHGLEFQYERHGDRNSVERVFRDIKRRTILFSNCFSNARATTVDQ